MRELNGLIGLDLIHEYRTWGFNKLTESREVYERDASDMAREFGELHFIPLALYRILGDLQDELAEFRESKALRMRIRDQVEKMDGGGHPYYIESILNVAKSHSMLGEWMEVQALQEEVLKYMENTHGVQSSAAASIKTNLATTFSKLGRWKEAEMLEVQ